MSKKILNKSNTNVAIDNIIIKPFQSIIIEEENITEEARNRINSYLKLNAIKVFDVEKDITTDSIKQRSQERKVEEVEEVQKSTTTTKKKSTRKKTTKVQKEEEEPVVEQVIVEADSEPIKEKVEDSENIETDIEIQNEVEENKEEE